jgi:pyruvate formate lyase activating enzyme
MADALRLGGMTPLTTIDYPGCLSAVLFCQGCPWRCGYCHNAHLQPFEPSKTFVWSWERVVSFLEKRRDFLDAIVFSGGEPTAQEALLEAVREVRALGFRIGLHTAGAYPERLKRLLPYLDWIGLDIKAPLDERYARVTGRAHSHRAVRESLRLVLESGVPNQLRTTVDANTLSPIDQKQLSENLDTLGAAPTIWQRIRKTEDSY